MLPATDQFEREDLNIFVQGVQKTPYVQWTGKVTEPDAEQREEWRFLAELLAAVGRPVALDASLTDPLPLVYDRGLSSVGVSIEQLRDGDGIAVLPDVTPGDVGRAAGGSVPRSSACPTAWSTTLQRGHELFAGLQAEPADQCKLITRRTQHMLNSALQNVEKLKARGAAPTRCGSTPTTPVASASVPTTSPRSPPSTPPSAHRCASTRTCVPASWR